MLGASIHPAAHVDDRTVSIGARTRIWQFASVIRGAVLGEGCSVASCAIVDGAKLGNGCVISHGASINPGFVAGDRLFVGPNATICNDMWPAANKEGFDIALFHDRPAVIAGNDVSIGANAVILPGVRLGDGCLIAAGSVVDEDVLPGGVWRRNRFTSLSRPSHWREIRMRFAK